MTRRTVTMTVDEAFRAASKSCGSCRHWRRSEPDGGEMSSDGDCLRYPPQVIIVEDMDTAGYASQSLWPYTDQADVCGEFSPGN